jgi:arginine repressor
MRATIALTPSPELKPEPETRQTTIVTSPMEIHMFDRKPRTSGAYLLVLASLLPGSQMARPSQADSRVIRADHAVAGEVRKVDHAAKTVVLHTAEGGDETVGFSADTVVHGVTSAGSAVDAYAKDALEGAWALVHYIGNGAHRTAVAIDSLGGRRVKVAHGSVVSVDQAAEFIVIKTSAGAENTFELARHVVVDAVRGVERGATPTCRAIEEGAQVAISYSEQAGRKTAVVVKRI